MLECLTLVHSFGSFDHSLVHSLLLVADVRMNWADDDEEDDVGDDDGDGDDDDDDDDVGDDDMIMYATRSCVLAITSSRVE